LRVGTRYQCTNYLLVHSSVEHDPVSGSRSNRICNSRRVSSEISDLRNFWLHAMCACTEWYSTYEIHWENRWL